MKKILSFTLFKVIAVFRPSTLLRMFLWGIRIEFYPLMPKILNLTLLLDVTPHQKLSPLPFLHASPHPFLADHILENL